MDTCHCTVQYCYYSIEFSCDYGTFPLGTLTVAAQCTVMFIGTLWRQIDELFDEGLTVQFSFSVARGSSRGRQAMIMASSTEYGGRGRKEERRKGGTRVDHLLAQSNEKRG